MNNLTFELLVNAWVTDLASVYAIWNAWSLFPFTSPPPSPSCTYLRMACSSSLPSPYVSLTSLSICLNSPNPPKLT